MDEKFVTLDTFKSLTEKGFSSYYVKPRTCIFPSLEMLAVMVMIYAKLIMELL